MMDFEDQLRESLRRTEPPAGFADRVIARAAAERHDNRRRWTRWGVAGAMAASLFAGAIGIEQWRERQRGQEAREQLLQAMEITGSKLQKIQKKIQERNQ
jgi:hypothetical protein